MEREGAMRLVVCRDGGDDDGAWHAVEMRRAMQHGLALCGVHPATEWAGEQDAAVTCPRCLRIKAVIED